MLLLGKDELQERLELLDADAAALFNDGVRYHVYITGGGALLLMGYTSRATSDMRSMLRSLDHETINI